MSSLGSWAGLGVDGLDGWLVLASEHLERSCSKSTVPNLSMLAQQANPELFACASVAWPKATARSHRRQVFVVPEALVVIGGWEPRIAVDHDSCQLFAALDSWPWFGPSWLKAVGSGGNHGWGHGLLWMCTGRGHGLL